MGKTQGFLVPGMECLLCSLHWPEGLKGEEIKKYSREGVSKCVEADFSLPSKGGALGCLNSVTAGSLATRKPEWCPSWVGVVRPSPVIGCLAGPNITRRKAMLGTQPSTPTGYLLAASCLVPRGPCGIISWWLAQGPFGAVISQDFSAPVPVFADTTK